jgi:signal peptidase II
MTPRRHWTDNFRSPLALLLFFGTAALGVAADLTTKHLAVEHLQSDERVVHVIPHVVELTYTANHGAVFGLGQGQQALFLVVSVGAILFLLFLFLSSERARVYQFILGLLLAGVIGNMYDRLRFGYVRDMIHGLPNVYWPDWVVARLPQAWQPPLGHPLEVFPWIFNVADSLLCVGVAAMLVYSIVAECHRKRAVAAAEEALGVENKSIGPTDPCLDPTTEKV